MKALSKTVPNMVHIFNAKSAHQNPQNHDRRMALVSNFLDKNPIYTALPPVFQDAVNKAIDKRVERMIHSYKPGIRNLRPRDIWEMAKAGISHGVVATAALLQGGAILQPALNDALGRQWLKLLQDVMADGWAKTSIRVLAAAAFAASAVWVVRDVIRSGIQYAPLAGRVRRETKAVVDEYARAA